MCHVYFKVYSSGQLVVSKDLVFHGSFLDSILKSAETIVQFQVFRVIIVASWDFTILLVP